MDMDNPHIDKNGTQRWYLNDKLHRTDGPAAIYADGDHYWCLNNTVHRTDGPAVIYANGGQLWYLNNVEYSFDEWLELSCISDEEAVMLKLKYG
jgi:hypothetical protein